MSAKANPKPVKVTATMGEPLVLMRAELYMLMYQLASQHRDEALKVDGKDQIEEIKHSMISVLFSYTCLEAFINTVGKDRLGAIWDTYKQGSTESKWMGVSNFLSKQRHGKLHSIFKKTEEPFKSFLRLERIREDYLVHRQAQFHEVVETKYGNTEGTINTLNADTATWSCETVKQMVLKLARNMQSPPQLKWLT